MKPLALSFAFSALLATSALAEPLGITGGEFRLGTVNYQDGGGPNLSFGLALVDVAITENHGAQADVLYEDGPGGGIGRLGGHVYMNPTGEHKFGLFGMLADVDGRSLTYAAFGAESMFALTDQTTLELRGGIGAANARDLDFIFAGAGLAHALSDTTVLTAGLDLAEFDERDFRAIGYEARVGLDYQSQTNGFGAFVEVAYSGLEGRDSAPAQTDLRLGMTWRFGGTGGVSPETRLFRTPDPVAQLVRRGFF